MRKTRTIFAALTALALPLAACGGGDEEFEEAPVAEEEMLGEEEGVLQEDEGVLQEDEGVLEEEGTLEEEPTEGM